MQFYKIRRYRIHLRSKTIVVLHWSVFKQALFVHYSRLKMEVVPTSSPPPILRCHLLANSRAIALLPPVFHFRSWFPRRGLHGVISAHQLINSSNFQRKSSILKALHPSHLKALKNYLRVLKCDEHLMRYISYWLKHFDHCTLDTAISRCLSRFSQPAPFGWLHPRPQWFVSGKLLSSRCIDACDLATPWSV